MAQLSRLFIDFSFRDPAVWLALSSGFAVVLTFLFLGRRQRKPAVVVVSDAAENEANPADVWLPPPKRPDERRRSTRRTGVPTALQAIDPKKPKKKVNGYVLDRSSGGLRIALEKPFPTGTALQVKPVHAPAELQWITITVRNCRECNDFFELGCQFQEELPWHILLMFG